MYLLNDKIELVIYEKTMKAIFFKIQTKLMYIYVKNAYVCFI